MNLREHPSASSDKCTNTLVIRAGAEKEVHIAYLEYRQTHEVGL
jgi:Icc-related predicted phosphoesterase